jgi:hypothetical protein
MGGAERVTRGEGDCFYALRGWVRGVKRCDSGNGGWFRMEKKTNKMGDINQYRS